MSSANRAKPVSPEAFMLAVETSNDLQEVSEKTGLTLNSVISKMNTFRKNYGLQLKRLGKRRDGKSRKQRLDLASLQSYLDQIRAKNNTTETNVVHAEESSGNIVEVVA